MIHSGNWRVASYILIQSGNWRGTEEEHVIPSGNWRVARDTVWELEGSILYSLGTGEEHVIQSWN